MLRLEVVASLYFVQSGEAYNYFWPEVARRAPITSSFTSVIPTIKEERKAKLFAWPTAHLKLVLCESDTQTQARAYKTTRRDETRQNEMN